MFFMYTVIFPRFSAISHNMRARVQHRVYSALSLDFIISQNAMRTFVYALQLLSQCIAIAIFEATETATVINYLGK